jgi:hypothetical protein
MVDPIPIQHSEFDPHQHSRRQPSDDRRRSPHRSPRLQDPSVEATQEQSLSNDRLNHSGLGTHLDLEV